MGAQAVRLKLHDAPALGEHPGGGVPGDLIDGYFHLPLARHPVVGMGSLRYGRILHWHAGAISWMLEGNHVVRAVDDSTPP